MQENNTGENLIREVMRGLQSRKKMPRTPPTRQRGDCLLCTVRLKQSNFLTGLLKRFMSI